MWKNADIVLVVVKLRGCGCYHRNKTVYANLTQFNFHKSDIGIDRKRFYVYIK